MWTMRNSHPRVLGALPRGMGSRHRVMTNFLMRECALVSIALCGWTHAQTTHPSPERTPASALVSTMEPSDLNGFEGYPEAVRRLIETCLALTKQNLTYTYGSADPAKGGMDCSGTIYYVLRNMGVPEVPRTASAQYVWTRKAGAFSAVIGRSMKTFELDALQPGDLLFWTGTYATPVDPPVTHSMIYLGKRKKDGKPVMFGASNGRSYDGKAMWGVSVFDFKIPKARPKTEGGIAASPSSVFIGYAPIPGLKTTKPM